MAAHHAAAQWAQITSSSWKSPLMSFYGDVEIKINAVYLKFKMYIVLFYLMFNLIIFSVNVVYSIFLTASNLSFKGFSCLYSPFT